MLQPASLNGRSKRYVTTSKVSQTGARKPQQKTWRFIMIIQHNIMALNAHRQLSANNTSLQK
ncbi:MAG: hypothetical protein ACOYBG_06360, partial [Eubacteriales bacterium]